MPKEKSAGAIIFRKENGVNHYLLLNYPASSRGKSGQWGFAKGHVEAGETEIQTAEREIAEETGIKDLIIIPGFKEREKYFFKKSYGLEGEAKKKAPWVFKLVIFFLAETKTKDVKISEEHTGFVWLPIDEAVKKTTFKNSKKLLKNAHDYITKKTALR